MPQPPKFKEPPWHAMVALIAVGGLRIALPRELAVGPDWLFLIVVGVLAAIYLLAAHFQKHKLATFLGYLVIAIVTADMTWSLCLLVAALPEHKESSQALLKSACELWLTNILVFASWYWRLDAGGPFVRGQRPEHIDGAFLFPQMTLNQETQVAMGEDNWSPGFVDYLFLAFNTSTAFSPTDSPVLSRWAKVMMMIQSLISLTTVALLAARAVNIL
jgi:hypothetical protein